MSFHPIKSVSFSFQGNRTNLLPHIPKDRVHDPQPCQSIPNDPNFPCLLATIWQAYTRMSTRMFQYSFVEARHLLWDHHHQARLHHRGNTPRNASTSDDNVSRSRHHPLNWSRHYWPRLAKAPVSNEEQHLRVAMLVSLWWYCLLQIR